MSVEKTAVSRLSYVKRNIIWSGISNFFYILFPFVIRTLFINYLGSEYLGLNSLCTSIIHVLNAAEFGVSSAFAYRLYEPIASHDIPQIGKLLNFYRKVYFIIGTVILAAGIVIMPFMDKLIKEDIPADVNIYLVFAIYLLNAVLTYTVFAYKELILVANQRRDYVDMISCVFLSIMYCVQIVFIIQSNYYAYLLVLPSITILINTTKCIVAKKKYPDFICRGTVDNEYVTGFIKDAISMAIYKFRDMSRNTFDSIVISAFIGLIALSNYQNYYTVLVVPIVLRNIFANALTPSMGNCIASEDKQVVYEVYKVFAFVYIYITGWFAICYGGLIQDFIVIWLGNNFLLSNMIVLLFVIYYYVLGFCDQTKMFREAAGLWNRGKVFAGTEMFANLILNIGLVYWLGLSGIILATILTIIFINIPFENYIIFHGFFQRGFNETAMIYFRAFVWFVIAGVITMGLCHGIVREGYVGLIMKAGICVIIPTVLFFLMNYRTTELRYLLKRFNLID